VSLAAYSLGSASIAQVETRDGGKKAPPKRTLVALADRKSDPEPR
jgi:hypothetical protein